MSNDFITQGISPSAIITASGSGGTQAGLIVGAHLLNMQADIYGINVCDDEQYFINKIKDDIADWQLNYPAQSKTTPSVRESIIIVLITDRPAFA